uniref:Transposase n=1 Tax=Acrobeloides nanus TaxID=290746 RepID=A0A914C6A4_9BILA
MEDGWMNDHLVRHENDMGRWKQQGTIVELDETVFVKRKYNVSRMVDAKWIFGGVQRGTNKCFMVIVADRSAERPFY